MTAHCVITRRSDGTARCAVHARDVPTPDPCPGDGQPADPEPVHGDNRHGRIHAVASWAVATDRQRPLVIHSGNLGSAHPRHVTVPAQGRCWRRPETIPAGDAQ